MSIKSTVLSGVSPDTVYQSSDQSAVTTMYICNKSPTQVTVNIHLVPSGYTATPDNLIYYALQVAPNDTYVCDTERMILDDNDSVIADASFPNSLVVTVSYVGV